MNDLQSNVDARLGLCMQHVYQTGWPTALISTGGSNMKRLLALMVLSMFSIGMLSGCNTMAGAGKDVQKVGEKVEDKAQDCKDGKC
jgi:predicted small secreted protein